MLTGAYLKHCPRSNAPTVVAAVCLGLEVADFDELDSHREWPQRQLLQNFRQMLARLGF